MKLEPVYVWVLGTVKQAMSKLSRSLTPVAIGTPRQNQGDRAGNGTALPAGKVAWPVDPDMHDGTTMLAEDVFFAEYDAKKREVYMLDDISGARHPGAYPLERGFNVEILNGENRSGKGIVYRTAEYGSEGIAKNIFQHATADLIAHHLHPDPPDNSSQVYDPDAAGRHGGLHYPLRVREWLRKFCAGKTQSDIETLFAPLFNLGRNGDGTPAYGAAHWDRGDGTLSDEGGGPLANANDNNHILGITGDAKVNEGALHIEGLHGPIRKLYGPKELVDLQWEPGGKGPFIVRVEQRPDFLAKHRNHCGRFVPMVIKWQTWSDTKRYPPGIPRDPTAAAEKSDPGPKTGDPTPAPEKRRVPLSDPTPNAPKYRGDPTPAAEKGGGGDPGSPITGDPPDGGPPDGGFPGLVGGPDDYGEPAMDRPAEPVPRPGTTSPGQIETPSIQGHAEPALPDGPMTGRSSPKPYEQAWLNSFGWTETEFVKQPLGADLVAVPQYQSATPNDKATGADRWEPKYSQEAVFTVDKDGRVTSRDKTATGSGDFAVMPAKSNPKHLFVENKGDIQSGEDVSGLFVLSVNNGTNGIAGWFGIGSRLITGGLASGMKAELDFSSSATDPDAVFSTKDETGAAGTGAFVFGYGGVRSIQSSIGSAAATLESSANNATGVSREYLIHQDETVGDGSSVNMDITGLSDRNYEVDITVGANIRSTYKGGPVAGENMAVYRGRGQLLGSIAEYSTDSGAITEHTSNSQSLLSSVTVSSPASGTLRIAVTAANDPAGDLALDLYATVRLKECGT